MLHVDTTNKELVVDIPFTSVRGKIRIKERKSIFDYGNPYATRKRPFTKNNYVEWQIGYGLNPKNQDINNTALPDKNSLVITTLRKYSMNYRSIYTIFIHGNL